MVLMCLLPLLTCSAQSPAGPGKGGRADSPSGVALLVSWQGTKGEWSFSIFEWPLDRLPTLEDVRRYPVLQGLEQLRRKIAALPKGYMLSWEDQRMLDPYSVKPAERQRLTVPPPAVVADVRRFAATHHVELTEPDPNLGVPHKLSNGEPGY